MRVYTHDDVAQGSPEWYEIRRGVVTASEFASVCAKPGPKGGTSHREMRGRTTYLRTLAAEILTGVVEDSYENDAMRRGKDRESEARLRFELETGQEATRVGFIKNGRVGCSPDSLLGDRGMLEIKDAKGSVQIERLQAGVLPPEHKPQVMGQLMVAEREFCTFVSHCRGLPMLVLRVERDEEYIRELRDAVDRFVAELDALVRWINSMR